MTTPEQAGGTKHRWCAWCGDWEDQHDEAGCRICRVSGHPWEQREYRCDKFYETATEAEAGFERRKKEIYGHANTR